MTPGRKLRAGAAGALALALILLPATVANADHVQVDVSAPSGGELGETIRITAVVTDTETGDAVEGTELVFFSSASFAGVGGFLELGEAVTNDLGVAVFDYELRRLGTHTITIEGGGEPNVVSIPVSVGGQLYRSEARLGILPGAGGWVVTTVIASVWVIMIVVGILIVRVAWRRSRSEVAEGEAPGQGRLSDWLNVSTVVTLIMILVATGLVALLIRSPNTSHNRNPEGYDRSAVAFVEGAYLYPDFGLSEGTDFAELGRGLYVTNGCAGCHGVNAEGTTTARSPAFASYDWTRQVIRTGLPGMPSYSSQELNDTELNEIFAFLAEARGDLEE